MISRQRFFDISAKSSFILAPVLAEISTKSTSCLIAREIPSSFVTTLICIRSKIILSYLFSRSILLPTMTIITFCLAYSLTSWIHFFIALNDSLSAYQNNQKLFTSDIIHNYRHFTLP